MRRLTICPKPSNDTIVFDAESSALTETFSDLEQNLSPKKGAPRAPERKAQEGEEAIARARAELATPPLLLTRVLTKHDNALSHLWDREQTLAKAVIRTLHEFQRLQAESAGHPVAPPAAIDVSVDVSRTDASRTNSEDQPEAVLVSSSNTAATRNPQNRAPCNTTSNIKSGLAAAGAKNFMPPLDAEYLRRLRGVKK